MTILVGAATAFVMAYIIGGDLLSAAIAALVAALFVMLANYFGTHIMAYVTIAALLVVVALCAYKQTDSEKTMEILITTIIAIGFLWFVMVVTRSTEYFTRW